MNAPAIRVNLLPRGRPPLQLVEIESAPKAGTHRGAVSGKLVAKGSKKQDQVEQVRAGLQSTIEQARKALASLDEGKDAETLYAAMRRALLGLDTAARAAIRDETEAAHRALWLSEQLWDAAWGQHERAHHFIDACWDVHTKSAKTIPERDRDTLVRNRLYDYCEAIAAELKTSPRDIAAAVENVLALFWNDAPSDTFEKAKQARDEIERVLRAKMSGTSKRDEETLEHAGVCLFSAIGLPLGADGGWSSFLKSYGRYKKRESA